MDSQGIPDGDQWHQPDSDRDDDIQLPADDSRPDVHLVPRHQRVGLRALRTRSYPDHQRHLGQCHQCLQGRRRGGRADGHQQLLPQDPATRGLRQCAARDEDAQGHQSDAHEPRTRSDCAHQVPGPVPTARALYARSDIGTLPQRVQPLRQRVPDRGQD